MMLLAYTADGEVIATLDYLVQYDDDGAPLGMVDFAEHEAAGGSLTDVWSVSTAVGSGTWPEWLGGQARDFRVELEPGWSRSTPRSARSAGRIRTLVHRDSGHRRERPLAEEEAGRSSRDRRKIVGGPDRPLRLDDRGRTIAPGSLPPRRDLPLVAGG